jgi:hypothetical protein
LVITQTNPRMTFSGNYVDNCWIEWSNEHDVDPNFTSGFSFGGLSVVGNHFFASDVAPWFRWLVIAPKGSGQFVHGLSVSDNTFRTINGSVDRAEGVDTTNGTLDYGRFRNITFATNTFNGVSQIAMSPLTIQHSQNSVSDTWVVDGGAFMPFGSWARNTQSLVMEGAVLSSSGAENFVMPYVVNEQGAAKNQVNLRWPSPVRGKVLATIRCDNPT